MLSADAGPLPEIHPRDQVLIAYRQQLQALLSNLTRAEQVQLLAEALLSIGAAAVRQERRG